ncbi:Glutamine-rich protein 2 [Trapelia coarctata]|nr:Glutamine-rich protein 2 [Trapelia coarctata]
MKFFMPTVILGLFAVVAEAVPPGHKARTQNSSGQEASKALEAATRAAAAALSGISTSSRPAVTATIDRGEVPTDVPMSWQSFQRARGITVVAMDEHPITLLTNEPVGLYGIATYGLNGGVAVTIVSPRHMFLVHNSMEKWQANGVVEFGNSLPPALAYQNTVVYFVQPSSETLNRWQREGRNAFSKDDYSNLYDNIERVLIFHGLRRRVTNVGYGIPRPVPHFSRGTILVGMSRRCSDVVPFIRIEGSKVPVPVVSSPHAPTTPPPNQAALPIHWAPSRMHRPPPQMYPIYHQMYPGPPPVYAGSPLTYAGSPPMHFPPPPTAHTQWPYAQWAPTQGQPYLGRFPAAQHSAGQFPPGQNPSGQNPPGRFQPGYYIPGLHPYLQPPQ